MPDVVDAETRSRMMSGIRSRNTKPEITIRKLLHKQGFRFRLHNSSLPGKPDVVLKRFNAVILVQGCFWHGHDCHLFKWPGTRSEWWRKKIESNQTNDERVRTALHSEGWRICEVWECALKGKRRLPIDEVIESISNWLLETEVTDLVIRSTS